MLKIHLLSFVVISGLFAAICDRPGESVSLENAIQDTGLTQLRPLTFERAAHSSTRLPDGRVLIAGGMRVNEEFHDTGEIFDPKTGKFSLLSKKMTKARVSHTATLLKDGRVLIVGGWSNRTAPEKSAELYDPKTGLFKTLPPMADNRSGHTATLLKNGTVLITGGNSRRDSLASIELFDPETESFRPAGKLNSPRKIHTATLLPDDTVLITGGETERETVVATAEIYDPKTEKAESLESEMSDKRYKHEAVLMKNGRVLIYGGSDPSDWRGRLKSAEEYDPKTKSFRRVGDMNLKRFKVSGSSVSLKDGRVLIAGGAEQAELFDPKTGQFKIVDGSYDDAYYFASATLLDDGRALIVGGYKYRTGASPLATNGAWVYSDSKLDSN